MNEGNREMATGKQEMQANIRTRRSANIAARNRLVEMHPKDFRVLLAEEYQARGLELEPTPEEKADKRLQDLLHEHPELREKYGIGTPISVSSDKELPLGSPPSGLGSRDT